MGFNQLTALPPEIGQLKKLTELYLNGNQLTALPPEIVQLTSLTELDLRGNQLTELPPEILQLTNLTELNLSYNQLSALPPEIVQLTNLTELDLGGNQLTALPSEIVQLTNLIKLDLSYNQLTTLPPEIVQLTNLTELDVRNNPLQTPPLEIANRGIKAIRDYFKSLQEESRPLNEVKIIFIGDGGAGKTSLMKRITGKEFDPNESQTHGINIEHCQFNKYGKEIKVNLWDFGGQEIMHATHQFFLSKRSLYVLVLDGRKDEKTEYWLKHVETFGGDSPVLVVINKIDENPGFELNRSFLQNKYKNIKGFYRVSCAKNIGIDDFIRELRNELDAVELTKTTWGKSWFTVKTQMENLTENFINYEAFQRICKEARVTGESARDTLVGFLNDLGIAIHFSDFNLSDTYILEPKWITNAVYTIINSPLLAESRGVFNLSLLKEIFKRDTGRTFDYPQDKYKYIIDLMKKFELCYEIKPDYMLAPQLLDVEEKKVAGFDYDSSLRFELWYEDFSLALRRHVAACKHAETCPRETTIL